jgi:hypothetical protein
MIGIARARLYMCARSHYVLVKNPRTHRIRGWVGPTASLDVLEKMKVFFPAGDRTPDRLPVYVYRCMYVCIYIYATDD